MKKTSKLYYAYLLICLLVPICFLGSGNHAVSADTGSAQVIIHKKKMLSTSGTLQNTGKVMSEFDQYQGLSMVEFKIYDVTNEFYQKRQQGATVDEAKQAVQSLISGNPIAQGTTDSEGNLILNLPKLQDGKDAVYVIKEEQKDGITPAANMVIAFPMYEMIKQEDGSYEYGTEELDTIHLYPKNTVTSEGTLIVKKIGSAEKEALDGAEFILSKTEGGIVKYIHSVKDGLYTWTTDQTAAKHFVTGHMYDIGDKDFSEEKTDNGQLIVNHLEVGAYVLEEVKAPDNATIIEEQRKTSFEITSEKTQVEKTITNDTSKVEKTTPKLKGQDVTIGEHVHYEISVNIPQGIADKEGENNKYTKFHLIDTHDPALSLSETLGYTLYDGDKVIDPVNYTVTLQENGFTVAIAPAYIPLLTPGNTLRFVYFMHLNELADPTKGYKNQAKVENGYTEDKTPPTTEIVTGGKRFVKVDGDVSTNQPLAGAQFVVRDKNVDASDYLVIDSQTNAVSWTSEKNQATVFVAGEDGIIDITGLKYGTYFLEETQAPKDYVLLHDRISFGVDEYSYQRAGQLVEPEKVPNKHKGLLPSTGGKGIYLSITIGLGLSLIAVGYFLKKKRNS